jgi:hypothetical protein
MQEKKQFFSNNDSKVSNLIIIHIILFFKSVVKYSYIQKHAMHTKKLMTVLGKKVEKYIKVI